MSAAPSVVIPNFAAGGSSSCEQLNHLFCFGWVERNWSGVLEPALWQHVELTAIAVGLGLLLALGLAVAAYRLSWLERPLGIGAVVLYTIPSLALFELLVPVTGLTQTTAEIALVGYTLVILFRNILTGLREVPADVRETARGMGMTARQSLLRVELPLALPSIMAGLRIATVSMISLATVAAYVCGRGLGAPIFDAIGENVFKTELIAAGALAIALAIAADLLLVGTQRLLTPWARVR